MRSTIKTIIRRLRRAPLFSFLNVFGLAIGISACWVICQMVGFEFSYENKLENRDQVYRLVSGFVFDNKESWNGGVSKPMYQALRDQVPQLQKVVPVFRGDVRTVKVGSTVFEEPVKTVQTDSAYFDLIHYQWLAGNPVTALKAPENLVLTASAAKTYFGNIAADQLLGRSLFQNDTVRRVVTGVVADLDYPTEFDAKAFTVLKKEAYPIAQWSNTNGSDQLYVETTADTAAVMNLVRSITEKKMQQFESEVRPDYKFNRWFHLMPLRESHFSTYINEYENRKANKKVLYGLIALGAFLLLLACINYINLSTARVPQQSKEIGMRKLLGSDKKHLAGLVFGETLFTVLLAAVLALVLSRGIMWSLGDLIPPGVREFSSPWPVLVAFAGLLLLLVLLAGWYPSWLITRVRPLSILRGHASKTAHPQSLTFRKSLIVFQFVIAQVFIIGALIMGMQLRYTTKKDMGFNKEAVLLVDIPWKILFNKQYEGKQFALAQEWRRETGVRDLSLGDKPMESGYSSSQYEYKPADAAEPIKLQLFRKVIDSNYMRLFQIPLVAGRQALPSDTVRELVINETAYKALGFKTPQEALGKMIGQPSSQSFPIVGVVRDFHLRDFHETIDPMVLQTEKENLSSFNIKLNAQDPAQWQATIGRLEKKWNEFYPTGSFKYEFYDEALAEMYKAERNLSRLINLATGVAILISCLGLFGLAVISSFQRTKEIGIRKVLGASVAGVVAMLSTDFLRLILLAMVIASPIAWWGMQQWLHDFAYRIDIKWWMFAVSGLMALVIALLTIGFHALRAAHANPVNALRSE